MNLPFPRPRCGTTTGLPCRGFVRGGKAKRAFMVTMLPERERHNVRELEALNQRGGRMLTVVDLIEAGTLSPEMVAIAMYALCRGSSVLTAARPGGAGKTTLLAALLNLLPPGVKIVTVDRPSVIREALVRPAAGTECYLVHEIGDGNWYGYLWGPAVAEYFRLIGPQRRIASCLHADTLDELTDILLGPPLRVAKAHLDRVGILAFMHVDFGNRGAFGVRRRVASLICREPFFPRGIRYIWESTSDRFHSQLLAGASDSPRPLPETPQAEVFPPSYTVFRRFIDRLLERDTRSLEEVRTEVVALYRQHPELCSTVNE